MSSNKKNYFCPCCKKTSEIIKVKQYEIVYYSLDLSTNQWEDFAGDRTVKLQSFYCINCSKRITFED